MGRRTQYASRNPPLKLVVLLHGFKSEAYFTLAASDSSALSGILSKWLEERNINQVIRA